MIIIMTIVICDIFFYDWLFVIVYCVACLDEVENCARCAKEIVDKRATDGSNPCFFCQVGYGLSEDGRTCTRKFLCCIFRESTYFGCAA